MTQKAIDNALFLGVVDTGMVLAASAAVTDNLTTSTVTDLGPGRYDFIFLISDYDNTAHDASVVASLYTDSASGFGTEEHVASTAAIAGSATFAPTLFRISAVLEDRYARLKFVFTNKTGLSATIQVWAVPIA